MAGTGIGLGFKGWLKTKVGKIVIGVLSGIVVITVLAGLSFHAYQRSVDNKVIDDLRVEMVQDGEENARALAKGQDVEEALREEINRQKDEIEAFEEAEKARNDEIIERQGLLNGFAEILQLQEVINDTDKVVYINESDAGYMTLIEDKNGAKRLLMLNHEYDLKKEYTALKDEVGEADAISAANKRAGKSNTEIYVRVNSQTNTGKEFKVVEILQLDGDNKRVGEARTDNYGIQTGTNLPNRFTYSVDGSEDGTNAAIRKAVGLTYEYDGAIDEANVEFISIRGEISPVTSR